MSMFSDEMRDGKGVTGSSTSATGTGGKFVGPGIIAYGGPQPESTLKTLARRFVMVRSHDVSGVSGTGVVAEGTVFSNGAVAYTWLTHLQTMAWAPSIDVLKNIHGHGGSTRIVFIDPENP